MQPRLLAITGLLIVPFLNHGGASDAEQCDGVQIVVRVVHLDPFQPLAQLTHSGNWQSLVVDRAGETQGFPERFKLAINFFKDSPFVRRSEAGELELDERVFAKGALLAVCVAPEEDKETCPAPSVVIAGKRTYLNSSVGSRFDDLPCFEGLADDIQPLSVD